MRFVFIAADNMVEIDGVAHNSDSFSADANIHAIQWYGANGEVEYKDSTPNKEITDLSDFQYLIDHHAEVHQASIDAQAEEDAYWATSEGAAAQIRQRRDDLLAGTDWWCTTDRTPTPEQLAYRQALRDITEQTGFPDFVVFPTKP